MVEVDGLVDEVAELTTDLLTPSVRVSLRAHDPQLAHAACPTPPPAVPREGLGRGRRCDVPRVSFGVVSPHLEPEPEPTSWGEPPWPAEDRFEPEEDGFEQVPRPAWWRWVAIVVVLALVVATPFAYVLGRLLY